MKKCLSLLLALLLTLSVCGVSASAVATPITAGSSMATATNIPSFGVDYVSSLDAAGETDWFKFTTLSDDAYYFINSKNYNISNNGIGSSVALHVHLYDVYGQEIITSWGDATKSFSMNKKLETNTVYYIKVFHANRATGNYQVGISYQKDLIPNEMENASPIQIGQKYVQTLDGPGDVDWYQFSASVSGEFVIASKNYNISNNGIGSSVALHIHLYDRYSQELNTSWGDANISFSCKAVLEKGQRYYIRVFHANNATGTYEFCVSSNEPTKTLQSISVTSQPTKTTYQVGESFQKSGMVVRANYSDGTNANVTNYSVSGYNATLPGTQTLTVSYSEGGVTRTTTFTVRLIPKKTLTDIYIASEPTKTTYEIGEKLDMSGFVLHGEYSDGTTERITNYEVSAFDSSTAGKKTITVSVQEGNTLFMRSFNVTVKNKPADAAGVLQKILSFFKSIWSPLKKLITVLANFILALVKAVR